MTRPDRRRDKFKQQGVFKDCKWCGRRFEAYKPEHEFHCKACNNAWHAWDRKQERLQSIHVPQGLQPKIAEFIRELLADSRAGSQIEPIPSFAKPPQPKIAEVEVTMPKMIECEACGCERPENVENCPKCAVKPFVLRQIESEF